MASMLNNTNNGTIVLKDYIDLELIDLDKTSLEIVSNIYPKNYSKVRRIIFIKKTQKSWSIIISWIIYLNFPWDRRNKWTIAKAASYESLQKSRHPRRTQF